MKTGLPLLTAFVGIASVAADGANETITTSAKGAHEGYSCWPGKEGLGYWFYNSKSNGPYECTTVSGSDSYDFWTMFNAYRSGGTEGVHWKYTDNVNDGECLKDWKYYSSDGQTLIATISGRTTTQNDSRRWCALPVYRTGGVKGKQWDDCRCQWDD